MKIISLVLIISGEALAIYAELLSAKYYSNLGSFGDSFWRSFPLIIIGGALLVAGYTLGLRSYKNIWVVSVISVTSILIIEPLLNYFFMHQIPTRGAIIGFALGILGFVSAFVL